MKPHKQPMSVTIELPTRYRPSSYTETIARNHGEVFHSPIGESPSAIAYSGRKRKAVWHYRFGSYERMIEKCEAFLEGLASHERAKQARRAELAAYDARSEYKAGDIVYNSWGYDQTNIDWYVVISVTRRFLTLQPCGRAIQDEGYASMAGYTVPVPEKRGEGTSRHSAYQGGGIRFKHGAGGLWNGKPHYCSWYA